MKIAIRLPYNSRGAPGTELRQVAIAADQAGFHSGWVGDHIVYPARDSDSRNPTTRDGNYTFSYDNPQVEAWTSLAYVAGFTQSLGLGVGVCILPYRNPLILAKVIATLQELSGGRAICGFGIGWLEEEFQALHIDFNSRVQRLEQGMDLLRACWTSKVVDFESTEFSTNGAVFVSPQPSVPIPMYVGGHSDGALRRAVERADGWSGHDLDPEGVQKLRARMLDMAGGSLPEGFKVMVSNVLDSPRKAEAGQVTAAHLSTEQMRDDLERYREVGVDILLCDTADRSAKNLLSVIEVTADLVSSDGSLTE